MRSRNLWRHFPWFVTAAMTVVVAVNLYMAYAALHTFPGDAGSDGFDLSNHYDAVLDHVRREAVLGWTLQANIDPTGHPLVVLEDRSGGGLAGAAIAATAQRPLGDPRTMLLRFQEVAPGHYLAAAALEEKGQWDLELSATAGGHEFSTTRRIVVR
jgi:nitrogen fixation protein FixH